MPIPCEKTVFLFINKNIKAGITTPPKADIIGNHALLKEDQSLDITSLFIFNLTNKNNIAMKKSFISTCNLDPLICITHLNILGYHLLQ